MQEQFETGTVVVKYASSVTVMSVSARCPTI